MPPRTVMDVDFGPYKVRRLQSSSAYHRSQGSWLLREECEENPPGRTTGCPSAI